MLTQAFEEALKGLLYHQMSSRINLWILAVTKLVLVCKTIANYPPPFLTAFIFSHFPVLLPMCQSRIDYKPL